MLDLVSGRTRVGGSHALKAPLRDSCGNLRVMYRRSGDLTVAATRMSAAPGSPLVGAAHATGAAETGGERLNAEARRVTCVEGGRAHGQRRWTHLQVRQPGLQLCFPDGVAVHRLQPGRVKTRRMRTGSRTGITENSACDHMKGSFHETVLVALLWETSEPHDPVIEPVQ